MNIYVEATQGTLDFIDRMLEHDSVDLDMPTRETSDHKAIYSIVSKKEKLFYASMDKVAYWKETYRSRGVRHIRAEAKANNSIDNMDAVGPNTATALAHSFEMKDEGYQFTETCGISVYIEEMAVETASALKETIAVNVSSDEKLHWEGEETTTEHYRLVNAMVSYNAALDDKYHNDINKDHASTEEICPICELGRYGDRIVWQRHLTACFILSLNEDTKMYAATKMWENATDNIYRNKFPSYDSTPKAVLAAIAYSLAMRLSGGGSRQAEALLADEWLKFQANGMVP